MKTNYQSDNIHNARVHRVTKHIWQSTIHDPWSINQDDCRVFLYTMIIAHKFFAASRDANSERRPLITASSFINSLSLSHCSVLNRFLFPFNNDDTSRAMKMGGGGKERSGKRMRNARARGYRKPIDGVTSSRYRSRRDPSKNKGLTTVGLLHGRGMVCPIRSDRYSTPPYNLHGLMTSITLLRASAALRTARVVRSLGHGPRYATPVGAGLSQPSVAHGRAEHTRMLAEYVDTGRRVVYIVAVAAQWIFRLVPSAFAFHWRRVQEFDVRKISLPFIARR